MKMNDLNKFSQSSFDKITKAFPECKVKLDIGQYSTAISILKPKTVRMFLYSDLKPEGYCWNCYYEKYNEYGGYGNGSDYEFAVNLVNWIKRVLSKCETHDKIKTRPKKVYQSVFYDFIEPPKLESHSHKVDNKKSNILTVHLDGIVRIDEKGRTTNVGIDAPGEQVWCKISCKVFTEHVGYYGNQMTIIRFIYDGNRYCPIRSNKVSKSFNTYKFKAGTLTTIDKMTLDEAMSAIREEKDG